MSRFQEFWEVWPSPKDKGYSEYKRKADKKKCGELWKKRDLDKIADTIIYNVTQRKKFDKGWLQQNGGFLCAPLVYLRNDRWDDGEFADTRDDKKPKDRWYDKPKEEEGRAFNRFERAANQILFHVAYKERGFIPLGDELRNRMLARKSQVLANYAEMEFGTDYSAEQFTERLFEVFREEMRDKANAT